MIIVHLSYISFNDLWEKDSRRSERPVQNISLASSCFLLSSVQSTWCGILQRIPGLIPENNWAPPISDQYTCWLTHMGHSVLPVRICGLTGLLIKRLCMFSLFLTIEANKVVVFKVFLNTTKLWNKLIHRRASSTSNLKL